MIKAALFCICGVLLALQFKSGKSEYGLFLVLAVSIVLGYLGISGLSPVLEILRKMETMMDLGGDYFSVFMKIIGISYLAEFACTLCKDAGYGTLASQIEMLGKITILGMSSPVLLTLLDTLGSILS
jgi:stage III sporulation protein AD